jgi:hypothetical protein
MYQLYRPPELQDEMRKLEDKRSRIDYTIIIIIEGSQNWVVQDDGQGFPCFYNMESGAIVYEDPRFVSEVSDDIASQKQFIMQELRYALYFCQDYWDKYNEALKAEETNLAMSIAMQNHNKQYFCPHCKRETKRHLDFCPTCGKRQLF